MSLPFSNSANKSGIVELIYSNTGADTNKYPLIEVVRDVNAALDKVVSLILKSDGRWQFDDSNFTDYPIITTDLVAGQRDYSFTADANGNLILDIYKVMVKDPSGKFIELLPVDQQEPSLPNGNANIAAGLPPATMVDGLNTQGTPSCYDKTANGIFLDLIPSYSQSGGLKVFINREASYFTTANTTKKPGFSGIFHEYLALRPSYQYAYRKGLQNAVALQNEMLRMEEEIKYYYGRREKDERKRMAPHQEYDR